jgi:hypothetical protein
MLAGYHQASPLVPPPFQPLGVEPIWESHPARILSPFLPLSLRKLFDRQNLEGRIFLLHPMQQAEGGRKRALWASRRSVRCRVVARSPLLVLLSASLWDGASCFSFTPSRMCATPRSVSPLPAPGIPTLSSFQFPVVVPTTRREGRIARRREAQERFSTMPDDGITSRAQARQQNTGSLLAPRGDNLDLEGTMYLFCPGCVQGVF